MSDYKPRNYDQDPVQTRPLKHQEALRLRKAVEDAIARGIPYEILETTDAERKQQVLDSMKKSGRYNVL